METHPRPANQQESLLPHPLPRDLEAVILSERFATDYILQRIGTEELGFRWVGAEALKNQQCVAGIGMFSQSQGDGPIWQEDRIKMHCNKVRGFRSEYLSLSVSPRRIVDYMVCPRDSPDGEVAVISMEMLRIMQRPVKRTTDLRDTFKFRTWGEDDGRTKYVTETHMLVYEFIPACCILGYIKSEDFKDLAKDITKDNDPDYTRRLTWTTLQPRTRRTSSFSVSPSFSRPAVAPQPAVTTFPMTPPRTSSRRQTQPRTEGQPRGQAPSPSPTPRQPKFKKDEDEDMIDLTKIEFIDLTASTDQTSFSRTVSHEPRMK